MKTLLVMTLGGSALALLLLILRYLVFRKMPSTVYYYAWLLVLLRFALPLPGLVPTQTRQSEAPAPIYTAAPIEERAETIDLPLAENAASPQIGAPSVPETERTEAVPAAVPSAAQTAARRFALSPELLWLSIWALGAACSLSLTVCAYLRFTRQLRRSLRRPAPFAERLYAAIPGRKPALWRSRAVRTPLLYGLFAPKIVLPDRDLDAEQLGNILRHELTHYRRRDTLYKWLAVFILGAHWFNPLSRLIRRELSRACELSCDEALLRSMSRGEKQSYGDTLLNTAAAGALPAGVVATTFSTEKRDLKERLEQIMTYKKSAARVLAAVLTLVLLAGCGLAAGPAAGKSGAPVEPDPSEPVRVSSVDELLAAIAPNTLILLDEGEYDLSAASDYGRADPSPFYTWNPAEKDGYELEIRNVENLSIFGSGLEATTIAAVPRYANVLKFVDCSGLTLSELTAGHTKEPGWCRGGVVALEGCGDVSVLYCGLYGCGTVGVSAADCSNLSVAGCHIYECSSYALNVTHCRNVRATDNEIDRLGVREGQGAAAALFAASNTDGFVVCGNRVYGNAAQYLLTSVYTRNAFFLTNEVHDNRFESAVFSLEQYPVVADGCAFRDNGAFEPGVKPLWTLSREYDIVDRNGEPLDDDALEAMTLEEIDPNGVFLPVRAEQAAAVPAGEEIRVSTVDDFLKAVGPERTVVLDGELFDLSAAVNYGSKGGAYYYWKQNFDGPTLVIRGVKGLTILASSDAPRETTISAVPRYADVLGFEDCEDLTLAGFTAGHTKEPGSCSGGVLSFENCSGVRIERCRLFGCGILGLRARLCKDLVIASCVIYECSQGAGSFYKTEGVAFSGCVVRDVPSPALEFNESSDVTWNGETLSSQRFDIDAEGKALPFVPELTEEERQAVLERDVQKIADLQNPFFDEAAHEPDAPQRLFAAEIRRLIADGDWETLADRLAYPFQYYVGGEGQQFYSKESFLKSVRNENFIRHVFNEDFRARVAAASLEEFGVCPYGETCCDHLIAITCVGNVSESENFRVSCISTSVKLWPGNPAYTEMASEP